MSICDQEVRLVEDGRVVRRYPCSTAKAGAGNRRDSGMTPVGWHRVAEKAGDGLAAGAVLKDRQWSGRVWEAGQGTQEDLILARILWLEGLEDGLNRGGDVDSRQRYIYIHGTKQTAMLGRPGSGGCIRLAPDDMVDLYNRIKEGCRVLITEE